MNLANHTIPLQNNTNVTNHINSPVSNITHCEGFRDPISYDILVFAFIINIVLSVFILISIYCGKKIVQKEIKKNEYEKELYWKTLSLSSSLAEY